MEKRSSISKGVVIRVYVESPRTRSIKPSEDQTKKTKPHPPFRKPQSSVGYDRRAHLLAYSRQLRENAHSQKNHSRPRSKKWFLSAEPVRICSPSTLMPPTSSTHFGYERVEPNERKPGGNKCCTILRKLKSILKTLSCKEMEL